jgi:hypothetical protein
MLYKALVWLLVEYSKRKEQLNENWSIYEGGGISAVPVIPQIGQICWVQMNVKWAQTHSLLQVSSLYSPSPKNPGFVQRRSAIWETESLSRTLADSAATCTWQFILETQLCQMGMTQKTIVFPLYQIYWHGAISWRSGKLVGSGEGWTYWWPIEYCLDILKADILLLFVLGWFVAFPKPLIFVNLCCSETLLHHHPTIINVKNLSYS